MKLSPITSPAPRQLGLFALFALGHVNAYSPRQSGRDRQAKWQTCNRQLTACRPLCLDLVRDLVSFRFTYKPDCICKHLALILMDCQLPNAIAVDCRLTLAAATTTHIFNSTNSICFPWLVQFTCFTGDSY